MPRLSSRRWSWPTPCSTSCSRRCCIAWNGSRLRSATRWVPRSASVPGRRRTASWSGWPTLSLLSDVAEEHPLVCLVDDEQWLDRASAQVLAFVARRLEVESVGLVFAARVPERGAGGIAGAGGRGPAGGRCPGAAGRGGGRPVGCAGPGPAGGRDRREPAGPAGVAPGVDAGGAGGRVRPPRRAAARRGDRGELPAAARGSPGGDSFVAAGGGGRSGRRPDADVASGRATRASVPRR